MYNDYLCNDIKCGYGFINNSYYVGYFNREECHIGAVDIFPKCGESL